MILKIRDPVEQGKWWYYDDIAKISTERVQVSEDRSGLEMHLVLLPKEIAAKDFITICIIRFRNGTEELFKLWGEIYLLNNEGKTIEKL